MVLLLLSRGRDGTGATGGGVWLSLCSTLHTDTNNTHWGRLPGQADTVGYGNILRS